MLTAESQLPKTFQVEFLFSNGKSRLAQILNKVLNKPIERLEPGAVSYTLQYVKPAKPAKQHLFIGGIAY
ncbi:MAG: hypothetical protein AAGF93_17100 [Cyanobacteria bacterium P01_H01_bin.105]